MSSPIIKISDLSWQLVCLCCNCAQEIKENLRLEVGPSFVEYNHRFTCPSCQTYNQILLSRDMFDNAHEIILHDVPPPSEDFNFPGFAPPGSSAPPNSWESSPPGSSPFPSSPFGNSSSPFGDSSPFGSSPTPSSSQSSFPSFEASDTPPPKPASAPAPAPKMNIPASKPQKTDDDVLDAADFGMDQFTKGAARLGARSAAYSAASSEEVKTITVAGREIPLGVKTYAIGGGILVGLAVLLFFIFGGSEPAPAPAPTPAQATAPTPAPSNAAKPTAAPAAQPTTVQLVEAQMALIPGGEYSIGRADGGDYERPSHTVTLKPFQIDVREVTREEYAKFVEATGHKPPKSWEGGNYKGNGRLPVTDVDWNDADAYAKWAGKRLPTEAEWETAASGKEHFLYPWGNDWDDNRANTREMGTDGPQAAGTFQKGKSDFGVYDMSGNVWEWVASKPSPYPGSGAKIANSEKLRVSRGGAYNEGAKVATASARNWVEATVSSPALGFRCAKDAE